MGATIVSTFPVSMLSKDTQALLKAVFPFADRIAPWPRWEGEDDGESHGAICSYPKGCNKPITKDDFRIDIIGICTKDGEYMSYNECLASSLPPEVVEATRPPLGSYMDMTTRPPDSKRYLRLIRRIQTRKHVTSKVTDAMKQVS